MKRSARLRAVLVVAAIATLAVGGSAAATWTAHTAANHKGRSVATAVPAGAQPTAGATGASVTVDWSATTDPPATGYVVRVYDAVSGVERAIGASCAGVVAALECIESSVPDGTWRYTVTPRVHAWVGSESSRSSALTVEAADPAPTALALVNGGGPGGVGIIDPTLDSVRITFSEPLAVASMCSAWSDDASDQQLSGSGVVVAIADNGGANVLTVASDACTFHIGSVALGADYLTGTTDASFTGTLANSSLVEWDRAGRTLTIHFGALASGALSGSAVSAATATYTPDAAITDLFAHGIVTTPFTATLQRF